MPPEVFVIILAGIIFTLVIVIIALATAHQQKMAELEVEKLKAQGGGNEAERLKQELAELKSLVYQQALEADSLRQLLQGQVQLGSNSEQRAEVSVNRD